MAAGPQGSAVVSSVGMSRLSTCLIWMSSIQAEVTAGAMDEVSARI